MLQLKNSSRKIDTVFIVSLFVMFAITAILLILIGARQYRFTADSMNRNYEIRTASSYLTEKVHQSDTITGVSVVNFSVGSALALTDRQNDQTYITYIYYYDGALKELFVKEDAAFTPSAGQTIVQLHGFVPEVVHTGLIRITFTDTQNKEHSIYLDINAASGKEM